MRAATLLVVSLVGAALGAQEAPAPTLQVTLGRPDGVWVGQRQPLIVKILAPSWFAGATAFDLPEVPGLVLLDVSGRPVVGSETIDGQRYTTRTHELAVFAFRAGAHEIPPFAVRFRVAGKIGTKEASGYRLETPALRFAAKTPPGAENVSMLISTTALDVTQRWRPEPGEATVGDAIVREIEFRAPDVPGMAFPPIPFPAIDGLATYPKPPSVDDRTERGEFIGRRVDAVTYVCERPGPVAIPALVITWWNLEQEKLERVRLAAATFEVKPGAVPPASTAAAPEVGSSVSPWWWAFAAGALGAAFGLWTRRATLASWLAARRERRAASESGRFAALIDACRANDPKAATNALYRWLDAMLPTRTASTVDALTTRIADADLHRELRALERALLEGGASWSGGSLANALRRARSGLIRRSVHGATRSLPPLNPGAAASE